MNNPQQNVSPSSNELSRTVDLLAISLLLHTALYQLSVPVISFFTYYLPLPLGGPHALDNTHAFYSIIYYCISFLLPAFLIFKLSPSAEKEISFEPILKKSFIPYLVMTIGCVAIAGDLTLELQKIIFKIGIGFKPYAPEIPKDTLGIILLFISSAIVPAAVEEVLFRKAILERLLPYGKTFALVLSAVSFSLMHANPSQFIFTFVAGLFLGYITVEYGSVFPAIILHFANNTLSLIYLFLQEFAPRTVFEKTVFVTDTLLKALGLFILVYIAKKQGFFKKQHTFSQKEKQSKCLIRVLPLLYAAYTVYLSLRWLYTI